MQEPHFLREIHKYHLQENKKHKNKTVGERLKLIQLRANKLETQKPRAVSVI